MASKRHRCKVCGKVSTAVHRVSHPLLYPQEWWACLNARACQQRLIENGRRLEKESRDAR